MKSTSIYNTTRQERVDYEEEIPTVHLEIVKRTKDSGAADGKVTVKGTSPDGSVVAWDFDINEAAAWAVTNEAGEHEFTSLDLGDNPQVIQARDYGGGTPGDVSRKIYINV